MLKRLPIFAVAALIVAVILMAVYYQQRNTVSQGYDIKCVQPSEPSSTANSLTCAIYQSQNAEQGHPSLRWWNVLIAWPEGITAWLLLGTLAAIVFQTIATAKSAEAAFMQIKIQEAQYKQWVKIGGWKDLTPNPISDDATLGLGFEVQNTTKFPLTLKHLRIGSGVAPDGHTKDHLIAPGNAHDAFYLFQASPAELELYKINQLIVVLNIEIEIKDVLERNCAPQRFSPTVIFGPDACNSIGHTPHFQMREKKTK